jgi:hypothetical protein
MAHEEYLRRNLLHCSSLGVRAGLSNVIDRLRAQKRPPKWLLEQLQGCLDRAEKVHPEMAQWRNAAPDAPR